MSPVRILRHATYCQAQLQLQLQFQIESSIALISVFSPPPTYPLVVARCVINPDQRRKCLNAVIVMTKHEHKTDTFISLSILLVHLSIHQVFYRILINWWCWSLIQMKSCIRNLQFLRYLFHKHRKQKSFKFFQFQLIFLKGSYHQDLFWHISCKICSWTQCT